MLTNSSQSAIHRQLHEQLLQEESTKSLARARRPTNLGVNQNLQHGQALVHGPSPASGVEKEDDHAGKRGNGVGFPTFGEGTANASEAECKVTQPALEEEWIRYFRDSPWTTRPCEHVNPRPVRESSDFLRSELLSSTLLSFPSSVSIRQRRCRGRYRTWCDRACVLSVPTSFPPLWQAPTLASLRTSPDNSHPLLVPRPSA